MKSKKNVVVKILALLALGGIIISIIGTALLVLTSRNAHQYRQQDIQNIIDSAEVQIDISTGSTASGNLDIDTK